MSSLSENSYSLEDLQGDLDVLRAVDDRVVEAIEAAAVAEALARYRQPEEWEGGRWADVEEKDGIDYRTRRWGKDG